nr:aminotransferase class I/II-fold pyridoxal phosphate-dependent enzyme [Actinomycetota bacterium]
ALEWIGAHGPDVVIVCSPNNPTGGCTPPAAIERLVGECPGLVVVDEAYGEFADPSDSVIPLLREHDNLVVVRTFSKAWRLAGVRIGYLLAAPELVGAMSVVRLPYHLSSLTQAVGVAALRAEEETMRSVAAIVSERERVSAGIARLGARVVPSRANFVLFEVAGAPAVWKALYERGVLVRSYEGSEALGSFLRVTIGRPEENDAFLQELAAVLP